MTEGMRNVKLTVNGHEYESNVEVRKTLADFLREPVLIWDVSMESVGHALFC